MKVETIREHYGDRGARKLGDVFDVTPTRARELEDRGLVRILVPKAARPPRNKMAPTPQNKGG